MVEQIRAFSFRVFRSVFVEILSFCCRQFFERFGILTAASSPSRIDVLGHMKKLQVMLEPNGGGETGSMYGLSYWYIHAIVL